MAKVEKQSSAQVIPSSVNEAINSIAKGLGVAAVELWSIFVRQYIVRGIAEAFTVVVLLTFGLFLWQYITWWALIPIGLSLVFAYGAILLLGNPKYYAISDITKKVETFTKNNGRL